MSRLYNNLVPQTPALCVFSVGINKERRKVMKKFLSLLLVCVIFTAALIACGEQTEQKATDEVASQAPTDAPTDKPTEKPTEQKEKETNRPVSDAVIEDFVPVMRFIAASDIHISKVGDNNSVKTQAIINQIYDFFDDPDANDGYAGLDAITVAGDIAENGKISEFNAAKQVLEEVMRENTELVITMGNHDWYSLEGESRTEFEKVFGPGTKDTVIGGYHFITICVDADEGWNYSRDTLKEARTMIEEAIADTGEDKPVFVFQHVGNTGTVAGTCTHAVENGSNAVRTLSTMENQYSNLVVFAGHSHFPANDACSIHQDDCTNINTGTLKASMSQMGVRDKYYMGQAHIVEVNAEGKLRIRHWDVASGTLVGDTWYVDSYDKKDFVYKANRFTDDDIFFADDAELSVVLSNTTSAALVVPATDLASLPARSYHITVTNAAGEQVNQFYYDTEYYIGANTDTKVVLRLLEPDTEYNVSVVAINSLYCINRNNDKKAVHSQPLTLKFKTLKEEARNGADIINTVIDADTKKITNSAASGLIPYVIGTPDIFFDESIGKNVLRLDGSHNGLVCYENYTPYMPTLEDSMTFDVTFKVDVLPTEDEESYGIVSSQDSGGFGLQVYPDSTAKFWIRNADTDSYETIAFAVETGKYMRVVATFDGSNCTVYLDGEKVGSADMSAIKHSGTMQSRHFYIGADSDGHGFYTIPAKCCVAEFKLYGYALSADEIK